MKKSTKNYINKIISYLLIITLLHLSISCRYFKVIEPAPDELYKAAKVDQKPNYFILHYKNNQYAFKNVELDTTALTGIITKLDTETWYYEGRGTRIKAGESSILNEVHVYVKDTFEIEEIAGHQSIPLKYLQEIKVIDINSGTTVASAIFGTLGVLTALLVIVALLSAKPRPQTTSSSSCPYIYSFNGETFVFEGEIFGGANMKSLERQDYLPLPALQVQGKQVKLQINNELEERHFIDLASLVSVYHPEGSRVLLDLKGEPQLISNPEQPREATTTNGKDLKKLVQAEDEKSIMFIEEDNNTNGIILRFKNNHQADEAKLIIRAKNSLWLDFLYSKFTEKFGSYFNKWMKNKSKEPYKKRWQRVIEENIPLTISVFENNKWKLIEHVPTVGPMAMRDIVIPFEKKGINGDLLVKIETGFMFWELDYVAIDYSKNPEMKKYTFLPEQVNSSDQLNWKKALKQADGIYMEQPEKGMSAELTFDLANHTTSGNQSFFLHSEGYYEVIREYSGLPKISELKKFKEKGYFTEYSRLLYQAMAQEKLQLTQINSK